MNTGAFGFSFKKPEPISLLHDQVLKSAQQIINLFPNGSLPSGYAYLRACVLLRTNRAAVAEGVKLEINDDTGNNYDKFLMWHNFDSLSDDEAVSAGANPVILYACAASAPTGEFGVYNIEIYDYAAKDKAKFAQVRGGQITSRTTATIFIYDGIWTWHPTIPAPITKIELIPNNGNSFIAGCRATLWGVAG